jgi:hypothetical protein
MADGHLNKCKACAKADVKADYRANPLAHRAYEQAREQTPERKAQKLETQRRHRANNVVQTRARQITAVALKTGRLMPQPCEHCGSIEKVEAHHEDYFKPLEVMWLCFNCHRKHHGQEILPNA